MYKITFIPYILLLLFAIYVGIFGFEPTWINGYDDIKGFSGFFIILFIYGLYGFFIIPIFPFCIIYQIIHIIKRKRMSPSK